MVPGLPAKKRIFSIGILIAGTILGIIYVTPKVSNNAFLGGSIGVLISFFVIFLAFPEARKSFENNLNKDDFFIKNYFTHPTQLPLMLGILWFIVSFLFLAAFVSLFPTLMPMENRPVILLFFVLSPTFSAIGYSGYQTIKRKESVNKYGQIYKGFWASLNGVLGILIGWGFLLVLFIIYIFN